MTVMFAGSGILSTAKKRREQLLKYFSGQKTEKEQVNSQASLRNAELNKRIVPFYNLSSNQNGTGEIIEGLTPDRFNVIDLPVNDDAIPKAAIMHQAKQVDSLDVHVAKQITQSIFDLRTDFKNNGAASYLMDEGDGVPAKVALQQALNYTFYTTDLDSEDVSKNLSMIKVESRALINDLIDSSIHGDNKLSSSAKANIKTILMNNSESEKADAVLALIREIPLKDLSSEKMRNIFVDNLGGGQVGDVLTQNLYHRLEQVLSYDKSEIIKQLNDSSTGNENLSDKYLSIDNEVARQFHKNIIRNKFDAVINTDSAVAKKFKEHFNNEFLERTSAILEIANSRYSDNPQVKEDAVKRLLKTFADSAKFLHDHQLDLRSVGATIDQIKSMRLYQSIEINSDHLDVEGKKAALKLMVKSARDHAGDLFHNPSSTSENQILAEIIQMDNMSYVINPDTGEIKHNLKLERDASSGREYYTVETEDYEYQINKDDMQLFLKGSTDPIEFVRLEKRTKLSSESLTIGANDLLTEIKNVRNSEYTKKSQAEALDVYQIVQDSGLHGKNDTEIENLVNAMSDTKIEGFFAGRTQISLGLKKGEGETIALRKSLEKTEMRLNAEKLHLDDAYSQMNNSITRGVSVFNPVAITSLRTIMREVQDINGDDTETKMLASLMEDYILDATKTKVDDFTSSPEYLSSTYYKQFSDILNDSDLQINGSKILDQALTSAGISKADFMLDLEHITPSIYQSFENKRARFDPENSLDRLAVANLEKIAFLEFIQDLKVNSKNSDLHSRYAVFLDPAIEIPSDEQVNDYKITMEQIFSDKHGGNGYLASKTSTKMREEIRSEFRDKVSDSPNELEAFFDLADISGSSNGSADDSDYRLNTGKIEIINYLGEFLNGFTENLSSLLEGFHSSLKIKYNLPESGKLQLSEDGVTPDSLEQFFMGDKRPIWSPVSS